MFFDDIGNIEAVCESVELTPPAAAVVFVADKAHNCKVRFKARKHFYGKHGIKFTCPICESIASLPNFSLYGLDQCPCCGVNLSYELDKVDWQ